jgi:hypothetical protein
MKTIRVFGDLAKRLKQKVFKADVATTGEAVRFLVANFPWLEKYMADRHYKVFNDTHSIGKENLHDPVGANEAILICPVIAGRGAVGKIIVGALLIVGSFFIPGAAAFLGIGLQGLFFTVGASLVLGGVAQLLSPTPATSDDQKDAKNTSYSFSGIQNTSRQGVAIPIVYGEVVTGSIVVSAFVDIEKI